MATNIITYTLQDGVNAPVAYPVTFSPTGELVLDATPAGNSTNVQYTFSFTKAKLKSIFIVAAAALTLKTNSSGSPQETIVLVANQPYVWTNLSYITNPFVGDVTTLYVTNALSAATTLTIRGTYDALT